MAKVVNSQKPNPGTTLGTLKSGTLCYCNGILTLVASGGGYEVTTGLLRGADRFVVPLPTGVQVTLEQE